MSKILSFAAAALIAAFGITAAATQAFADEFCSSKTDQFALIAKKNAEILFGSGLIGEVINDPRLGGTLPEGFAKGNILSAVTQPREDGAWSILSRSPTGTTCVLSSGYKSWEKYDSIFLEIEEGSTTLQITWNDDTGWWYMTAYLPTQESGFTIVRGGGWANLSDDEKKKETEKYIGGKI